MIAIRTANLTKTLTLAQRAARGLFVGVCGMLVVGVAGAVAARSLDTNAAPLVSHASNNVAAAVEILPVALAGEELLVDGGAATAALPGLAVETVRPVVLAASTPSRKVRTITMQVTAYCACTKCCGKNAEGLTASGKSVRYNGGRFVAADTRVLPFGTKVMIPGYNNGRAVEVIDTGSAIKGNKLDVFFASHETAKQWGRRTLTVTVAD
jgi:3D (Asp-Asp-Asp) domain-containing protein